MEQLNRRDTDFAVSTRRRYSAEAASYVMVSHFSHRAHAGADLPACTELSALVTLSVDECSKIARQVVKWCTMAVGNSELLTLQQQRWHEDHRDLEISRQDHGR